MNNGTKAKNSRIEVKGTEIAVFKVDSDNYISLTDIARYKDTVNMDKIIQNWLRNRNTIDLLGFWEQLYNPNFKPLEFDGFRKQAGSNSFVLTPKRWIETSCTLQLEKYKCCINSTRVGSTRAAYATQPNCNQSDEKLVAKPYHTKN